MALQYPTDTTATTNLGAYKRNILSIKEFVGPNVHIMAMIKANAYGHGLIDCARTAVDAGAPMLGVAFTAEGLQLREAGIDIPVLILSPESYDRFGDMLEHHLTPTLTSVSMLREIERHVRATNKSCPVHVNVDTGMTRVGVSENDVFELVEAAHATPGVILEGLYTHFPNADEDNEEYTREQIGRFGAIVESIHNKGIHPVYIHAANSAGTLKYPEAHFNMVRPGIMTYGLEPYPGSNDVLSMEQVLSWHTRIGFLKEVPAGTRVSYGGSFITERPSILATAPVGYGDGYRRLLSNRGKALVNGAYAPIAGRICMDQTVFDVTDAGSVHVGDTITLIGSDGHAKITAEDHARLTGTINYEIVTGIANRVSRAIIPAT